MTNIQVGTKVRYYQPGVDGILASWSGNPVGNDGELVTVTVTDVKESLGVNYYTTDEGVMLTDDDIREVL